MTIHKETVDYYSEPTKTSTGTDTKTPAPTNTDPVTPPATPPAPVVPPTPKVETTPAPVVPPVTPPVTPPADPATPPANPATPPPVTPPADEGFDLDIEDSSPLTEEEIDDIVAVVEAKKLTKEQAQQLVKRQEATYQRGSESKLNEAKKIVETMRAEVSKDERFSTQEKMIEAYGIMDTVVDKFGRPGLKDKIRKYLGNDADVLDFIHNVGKQYAEDTFRGKDIIKKDLEVSSAEKAARSAYPEFFE